MLWISIALVVIAVLAHHGFMLWLGRRTGWETEVARLEARCEALSALCTKAAQAANTTAVSAAKALDELGGRMRSCELKLGVRGVTRREPDGSPTAPV